MHTQYMHSKKLWSYTDDALRNLVKHTELENVVINDVNLPHLYLASPLGVMLLEFRRDFWHR